MVIKMSVNYKFLITKSKYLGYQSKKNKCTEGLIKINLVNLWNWVKEDFNYFVESMIYIILCERICIEYSFNHIIKRPSKCIQNSEEKCEIERFLDTFFFSEISLNLEL